MLSALRYEALQHQHQCRQTIIHRFQRQGRLLAVGKAGLVALATVAEQADPHFTVFATDTAVCKVQVLV